ncbi:hypothetical protein FHT10_000059 [Xanthomonas arboricola]|nr:hypothetical protein [Xanthomonas cannabis]
MREKGASGRPMSCTFFTRLREKGGKRETDELHFLLPLAGEGGARRRMRALAQQQINTRRASATCLRSTPGLPSTRWPAPRWR